MLLLLLLNGFRGRGVCGGAGAVRCQQLGTDASCTARDERLGSFQGTNERDLREGSESDSGREREREREIRETGRRTVVRYQSIHFVLGFARSGVELSNTPAARVVCGWHGVMTDAQAQMPAGRVIEALTAMRVRRAPDVA